MFKKYGSEGDFMFVLTRHLISDMTNVAIKHVVLLNYVFFPSWSRLTVVTASDS